MSRCVLTPHGEAVAKEMRRLPGFGLREADRRVKRRRQRADERSAEVSLSQRTGPPDAERIRAVDVSGLPDEHVHEARRAWSQHTEEWHQRGLGSTLAITATLWYQRVHSTWPAPEPRSEVVLSALRAR